MQVHGVLAPVAALALLTACGGGGETPTVAAPPPATEIRVVDADTVDVDGVRYRLHGIDAPERHQRCRAYGLTWHCGAAATEALMSRAEGLTCTGTDTDRFGRAIGVCSAGGVDLNAWIVAQGWALAYREFSSDYVAEEAEARANRRGIHRGEFVEPADWRRGERLAGEDTFAALAPETLDAAALADRMLRGDDSGVWGRWLEHSVFAIVDDAVAVSFGDFPGTNPTATGGGVWTGAMVGIDTRTAQRIDGDATLRIDDFARPAVNVALTGITDAEGRARSAVRWDDVPLADGTFRADGIEGRFYGPDHREVGGHFARDPLLGAFGGSRSHAAVSNREPTGSPWKRPAPLGGKMMGK